MRVWLDDINEKPEGFDIWVKTADEAMLLLRQGKITHISFDHDLGFNNGGFSTGYTVACVVEMLAFDGRKPPTWDIHSNNPVGRKNIQAAMEKATCFWEDHQEKLNRIQKETEL